MKVLGNTQGNEGRRNPAPAPLCGFRFCKCFLNRNLAVLIKTVSQYNLINVKQVQSRLQEEL
jgi:hypothetical protein